MADMIASDAPDSEALVRAPVNWWSELRGLLWLVLAVIAFHSLVAKPFYIPSESMMPVLLKGDRLVVSKYPYGWSWVSASFHILPEFKGRLFGRMPTPGDIVIVVPNGRRVDYIKRVIAVGGDTIQVRDGIPIINGVAAKRGPLEMVRIPVDANSPCSSDQFPGALRKGNDGTLYCELPTFRETLPNGRNYQVIDLGPTTADTYPDDGAPNATLKLKPGEVFLLGDNRDASADSRFAADSKHEGLGGPVPLESIGGRAEFITFSLDGSAKWWNPISWFSAMRAGRSWRSLHPQEESR